MLAQLAMTELDMPETPRVPKAAKREYRTPELIRLSAVVTLILAVDDPNNPDGGLTIVRLARAIGAPKHEVRAAMFGADEPYLYEEDDGTIRVNPAMLESEDVQAWLEWAALPRPAGHVPKAADMILSRPEIVRRDREQRAIRQAGGDR